MSMLRATGILLIVGVAAGCFSSDPYVRLARELTGPLGGTPRRVAVLPFRGLDPSLTREGEAVSERLLSYLYGRGGVVLIERSRLEQVMSEMSLGQTGAIDAKTAAEFGRLSGAQALVVGTVSRAPNGLDLSARVVDVQTGRLLAAATERLPYGHNLLPVPESRAAPLPKALLPERADGGWRPGADLGDGRKAPWPQAVFGAVEAKGRLYVIGGANSRVSGPGRGDWAAYSASIAKDGALGRWRAEEALPEGRYQLGSAVWGAWVFAVGGYDGAPKGEVFSARIGDGGNLSPWRLAARIPTGCTFPGVVAAAGKLHVAGCSSAAGPVHALFSAEVGSDGSLGDWIRTPLPEDAGVGGTLTFDGRRLLLIGGSRDGRGYSDAVYAVALAGLGKSGAAVRIGSLSEGMIAMPAAVSDGRLWILGGRIHSGPNYVARDVLESAPLTAQGGLGPWRRSPRRLAPAVFNAYAPLVNGAFYLIGGENVQGKFDAVQRVPVR